MVYVVTGGPGFGKTTVINHLASLGFSVGAEQAREVLSSVPGNVTPTGGPVFPADFERIVALARLNFLNSIEPGIIAFSDRGLPDQVAYSWFKNKKPSDFIVEMVRSVRYSRQVFVTPPWKEIYVEDLIRNENFEEALIIHRHILRSYRQYGYETIDLPLTSPELRVQFIRNFLGI
jgi:predicted ATPase